MTYQPGDQVTAHVTDTTGRDITTTLTVNAADALGCGCTRLTCDRPGPTPAHNGVHLLTGCATAPHERAVA